MSAIIFDGRSFAQDREDQLQAKIQKHQLDPRLGAIIFQEDKASLLYSKLKKQAAVRVGIEFSEQLVSIKEPLDLLQERIQTYCHQDDIDGILVQKPMKQTWTTQLGLGDSEDYDAWWRRLVTVLEPQKDLDCLTAQNLQKVYDGHWQILPATVKGVITILHQAVEAQGLLTGNQEGFDLVGHRFCVVGRSDLVGKPLSAVLEQYGASVDLFGQDLDYQALAQAQVVISATGTPNLIRAKHLKPGVIAIDVGAPKGDLDFDSVKQTASFITPVPGGVGPVTIVSLLENLLDLISLKNQS